MTDQPFAVDRDAEPLDQGGTWLLDLVSAVDHLRRGYRPGLTVWDALAEARRQTRNAGDRDGDAAAGAEAEQAAVRQWVLTMAERYNAGHHWPHPVERRQFPPARVSISET